jgi:hypothetical protein
MVQVSLSSSRAAPILVYAGSMKSAYKWLVAHARLPDAVDFVREGAVRAIKLLGGANGLGDCPVGASEPFGNRYMGKTTIDVKLGFQGPNLPPPWRPILLCMRVRAGEARSVLPDRRKGSV